MAQWIRPHTLSHEVPGLNLLASGRVPLGQETVSSLPSPLERIKAVGPLVAIRSLLS